MIERLILLLVVVIPIFILLVILDYIMIEKPLNEYIKEMKRKRK